MPCPISKCNKRFKADDMKHLGKAKPAVESASEQKSRSKKGKPASKGKDYRGLRPTFGPNQLYSQDWLQRIDDGEIDYLPSTKLNAIKDQVQHWLREKPQDKIIVFSQFKQFQIILGIALQELKIPFLYFSVGVTSNAFWIQLLIFIRDA